MENRLLVCPEDSRPAASKPQPPTPEVRHGKGTPRPDSGRGAQAVLLGVNSRDLQTLEVVPGRFREMASILPPGVLRVAESGITTPDDCAEVARDGYGLALVGSALMTAPDPAGVIRTMLAAGRAMA